MKDIICIGQDDAQERLFESQYVTPQGMSYNSYLIMDEHIALMDTSDAAKLDEWENDLGAALQGRQPDYLVVHHLEPDHAAGIGRAMRAYPLMKLVCSQKAAQMLPQYFEDSFDSSRIQPVKERDVLCLGSHTLQFFMAPMVHWPEVMVSYDSAAKTLFSADAFGTFGTRDAHPDDWATEARRYYFNICGKYGAPVSKLLQSLSGLEIDYILSLHGPILQGERLAEALRLYKLWSAYEVETPGVLIAYASIHGNTKVAVDKLRELLLEKGCDYVSLCDLTREDPSKAVAEAFRYGKVVLAASSYDAGVFSPMHDFLYHLQIKAWQKREVGLVENGSWSPTAARAMKALLDPMKDITFKGETVTLRGCLKQSDLPALDSLAEAML